MAGQAVSPPKALQQALDKWVVTGHLLTEPTMGQSYALGTRVITDDFGNSLVGHGGGGPEWPYAALLLG